jgi:CheY-like chemotaxis protein
MPVMDGLEATRRIRRLNHPKSQIPIIALTASIQLEERQDYLDAGISAIVGKPFAIRELRDTITVWMMPS